MDKIEQLAEEHATNMMNAQTLCEIGRQLAVMPSGGFVLEIGTYHGMTAAFMARVLSALGRVELVTSIDPCDEAEEESLNQKGSADCYHETIARYGESERCCLYRMSSHVACHRFTPSIALLLLDGSHTYENVKADLDAYLPKLLIGGVAILHDYWDAYPGVMQAVDEYFSTHIEYTIQRCDGYAVVWRKM